MVREFKTKRRHSDIAPVEQVLVRPGVDGMSRDFAFQPPVGRAARIKTLQIDVFPDRAGLRAGAQALGLIQGSRRVIEVDHPARGQAGPVDASGQSHGVTGLGQQISVAQMVVMGDGQAGQILMGRFRGRAHGAGIKDVRPHIGPGVDAGNHHVRLARQQAAQGQLDAVRGRAVYARAPEAGLLEFHGPQGVITLSDPTISREDAVEAAKLAGLHEVIAGMEQGYDTPCTDALFSQGQWQLLSIARAVAAKPSILLLDEITANLDVGTEQEVLYALRRAGENRTVVSISHRLYEKMGGRELVIG